MAKTFNITDEMDLIEIKKEGKFEEFKTAYEKYKKEFDEFNNLYVSILNDYFPEISLSQVDYSKISKEDFEKLPPYEKLEYLLYDGSKLRENLFEDKRVVRFIELKDRHLKPYVDKKLNKLGETIKDKNGKKFLSFIKNKRVYERTYSTIVEDAKKYDEPEVIDFIEKHPLNKFQVYKSYHKKLNEKLISIREKSGLDIAEFAKVLGTKPETIKKMETSLYIDEKVLESYACYNNEELYEFLEYKVLKNWVNEIHHDMFFIKVPRHKKK